jgi:hypothetical protein
MERTMWTDERLDDLSQRMDAGFDRVDSDIRELRGDVKELRTLLLQLWGSTVVGCIGVIASVLLTRG